MKKKIFALASALVLTFGMSVSVFAADSASTATTTTTVTAVSVDATITADQANAFAKSTTVTSSVEGAKVDPVSAESANAAAAKAKEVAGANAAIATIVDLSVPEGTGAADFTLSVPTVKAGQAIVVLHQKADGTWEEIDPKEVKDGAVTFTMTSYSPVAIVIKNANETTTVTTTVANNSAASEGPAIDAALAYIAAAGTAPKTGDMMMVMVIMASICLAGSVVFSKKAVH